VQVITLVFAVVVTLAANASSTRIWTALSTTPALRAAALALAEEAAGRDDAPGAGGAAGDPAGAASADSVRAAMARVERLMAIGVPLGWSAGEAGDARYWLRSAMGWLLTALAISLGAPFWFDVLNRFMHVRSAGRAPEERPKPPAALPPPRGP
jgi:hypothetical protein